MVAELLKVGILAVVLIWQVAFLKVVDSCLHYETGGGL
jgi:hypothetical protein